MTKVGGIHHITAIASDPQQTYDFYTKVLGLRLVKRTVNQDDTSTYHLFFGDRVGSPGMDLTFFTFQPVIPGRHGTGLVTTISLAVPEGSLTFWEKRLIEQGVKITDIHTKFGHNILHFEDQDGQQFELVEATGNEISISQDLIWTTDQISKNEAIRAFHSATLCVGNTTMIDPVLTFLGYEKQSAEGHIHQYKITDSNKAAFLEVDESPLQEDGINAAGTVHHIAFRVKDEQEQLELREKIIELGLYPTHVIDRFYFKSVYFRTPAGILFELATEGPGFTADEKEKDLGKRLALPPFLEGQRKDIEAHLPKIHIE